jgi:hypothetical protein
MSFFIVTNTTNSRSNTLANTLAPGSESISGYTQGGASITSTSLVNSTIESTTTNYKYTATDIGNSFCAIYNGYAGPRTGTLPVENYSKCTIVMCGGGGGGGGGGSTDPTQQTGGSGGDGGITIIKDINISSLTSITYTVGSGGSAGLGWQVLPPTRTATAGGAGNATNVVISSTTYTANAGNGGAAASQPTKTPGNAGNIVPTTQSYTSATLNGPLTYQTTPDRNITISSTTYGQGGSSGTGPTTPIPTLRGNNGQAGRPGYLRIYLYP